jgi:IS5 family transposase
MREVQRKLDADQAAVAAGGAPANGLNSAKALSDLAMWLQRAERIRTQQRDTKNKLYALHAPEVECISKGKARNPYEFGVKVSLAVTHKQGLMVGARSFPGNPYDGHVLSAQLEQTSNLLQDLGCSPKQVIVDLGYRGVDADNPGVQIIHRGKYKSLTDHEKRLLKRRQAIEPLIGHTKVDHRLDRCWLQGAIGDALHALSCAAGYNIRWLLRAIARLGLSGLFYALSAGVTCLACLLEAIAAPSKVTASAPSPLRRPTHRLPLSQLAALGCILQGRVHTNVIWKARKHEDQYHHIFKP